MNFTFLLMLIHLILLLVESSPIKLKITSYPIIYDPLLDNPPTIFRSIPITIPVISLCFGIDKNQCFKLAISTTITYTFLESSSADEKHFNKQYNPSLSQSYIKGTIMIGIPAVNNNFFGFLSKEILHLSNTVEIPSRPKLAFFLFDASRDIFTYPFDGYLGLRKYYHLDDESNQSGEYSLIAYLCNTKQITNANFAIKYNPNDDTNSYIEFDRQNKGTYPKCRLLPYTGRDHDADCSITEVSIGSERSDKWMKNDQIVFNSQLSLIIIPMRTGLFLFEYLIKVSGDKCAMSEEKEFIMLRCERSVLVEDFPDINIRLGEVDYLIRWINVMKEVDKEQMLMSMIILNRKTHDNLWIIGLPGFIDYEIIFDNQDRSVGFIYTPANIPNPPKNIKIIATLMIMSIIILFSGVCIVTVMIMKLK